MRISAGGTGSGGGFVFIVFLFDHERSVAHFADGVHEGDQFGRVVFERILGDLGAMLHQSFKILQERDFVADLLKDGGVCMSGFPGDVGGGFGLSASTFGEELCIEVILIAALTPPGKVVLCKVFAGVSEALNDGLVGSTVVEQAIDLVAEFGGQAGDLAVSPGAGLASAELAAEVVMERIYSVQVCHKFLGVRSDSRSSMRFLRSPARVSSIVVETSFRARLTSSWRRTFCLRRSSASWVGMWGSPGGGSAMDEHE